MKKVFALTAVLASVFWAQVAFSQDGKAIFTARNCGQCHQIIGPAAEKTIADQLARKGPELWYAGSKFKPGFLEAWLKDPKPIRPMEYYSLTKKNQGNHPKLDSKEAGAVAQYLMGLKSKDVRQLKLQAEESPAAKVVFIKRQACYGCHEVMVKGKAVGGLTGPSFVDAGKRLEPDWIYAYLSNSKAFKPVKDMPEYSGIISDGDMKAIASYIASL